MREQAREVITFEVANRDDEIVGHLKLVNKPVKPSEAELDENRRARSSIMRVAEKAS